MSPSDRRLVRQFLQRLHEIQVRQKAQRLAEELAHIGPETDAEKLLT